LRLEIEAISWRKMRWGWQSLMREWSPPMSALLLALRLRIERREATASPSSLGRGTLFYLL
jgi:hypothetical protein